MLKPIYFSSIFIFAFFKLSAQYTSFTTPMPHGGNMTTSFYMPIHNYGRSSYSYYESNIKSTFRFVLNNDSIFTKRSQIDIKDEKKDRQCFVTIKKKHSLVNIYPNDTKLILKLFNDRSTLIGIPADSCWLFKIVSGKINCYSPIPEKETMFINAIQKGDHTEIIPLTSENLKMMMDDQDQKILELIDKHKYMKAIKRYNARH